MILRTTVLASLWAAIALPAAAQTKLDRVDPARIERENLPAAATPRASTPHIEVPAPPLPAVPAGSVSVGAITFAGLQGLAPADFADIIGRYVGRRLSNEDMARLTEDVSARARARGYVFAAARVEPQRLMAGVLTIHYDPGRIDEVRLKGTDNVAVRAALAPLLGRPGRLEEVERRILLAGDIDGVSVRRSRFLREGTRGVLLVTIAESRVSVRAVADNDSTAPVGPEQVRIDADVNGVLGAADSVSATYVTTPFEPDELQYGRVRYARRVASDGAELSVGGSVASTRPGAYLDRLDLHGTSWSANVGMLQPLWRRRSASLWFRGSLDLREVEQRWAGVRRRSDRIVALRFGLSGNHQAGGGLLRGNVTLSRGLDALGATREGDPLASRRDADSDFTAVQAWLDWTRRLRGPFSLKLSAQGQAASAPLLVAEEIGIGGSAFLRGYDYSERSGDQGIMGSAEVRYDWRNPLGLGRKAQVYGFVDGGSVSNLAGGFGGGSLASGGGGLRADLSSSIDAGFEIAVPLTGPRYETGNRHPRFNIRLLKVF